MAHDKGKNKGANKTNDEPKKKRSGAKFDGSIMKKVKAKGRSFTIPKGYSLKKAGSNPDKLPAGVGPAMKAIAKREVPSVLEGLAVFIFLRWLWGKFVSETEYVKGNPDLEKWAGLVAGVAAAGALVSFKRKKTAVLVALSSGLMETAIRFGTEMLEDKPEMKKQLGLDSLAGGDVVIEVPYQTVDQEIIDYRAALPTGGGDVIAGDGPVPAFVDWDQDDDAWGM